MKTIEDYIIVLDNVLPKKLCKDIIDTYDSINDDDDLKVSRDNDFMRFSEINMIDHPAYNENTTSKFIQYMQHANFKYFDETCDNLKQRFSCYDRFNDYEAPRVKRYEPNKGTFDWHIDSASVESMRRALVMFWYLNDVEKGGETIFDLGEGKTLKVKPKAGRVVCFPPFFMFPHMGATPISGTKYVVSSYVCLPEVYGQSCD